METSWRCLEPRENVEREYLLVSIVEELNLDRKEVRKILTKDLEVRILIKEQNQRPLDVSSDLSSHLDITGDEV